MEYFQGYPHIYYELQVGFPEIIRDITTRVGLPQDVFESDVIYDTTVIMDGEMPEHVSYRVYGNPFYHWIILLSNQIVSPSDWPLSYTDVTTLAESKYDNINGIHHYEGISPITNLEYEQDLNESKRMIRVVKPDLISAFKAAYEDLMRA